MKNEDERLVDQSLEELKRYIDGDSSDVTIKKSIQVSDMSHDDIK